VGGYGCVIAVGSTVDVGARVCRGFRARCRAILGRRGVGWSLLPQVMDMDCELKNKIRQAREMLGSWLLFLSYLLVEYLSHSDYLLRFQCLPRLRLVLISRHRTLQFNK